MTLSGLTALSSFTDKAPVSPTYMNAKFGEIQANLNTISALPLTFSGTTLTVDNGYALLARSIDSGGMGVSLLAFGADATGGTDCRSAVISAASAAKALAGGRGMVFVPPGVYRLDSTVTLGTSMTGVRFRGAGRYSSIFSGNHPNDLFNLNTDTGLGFEGLGFNLSGSTYTNAIALHATANCNELTVRDCEFLSVGSFGILFEADAGSGALVADCAATAASASTLNSGQSNTAFIGQRGADSAARPRLISNCVGLGGIDLWNVDAPNDIIATGGFFRNAVITNQSGTALNVHYYGTRFATTGYPTYLRGNNPEMLGATHAGNVIIASGTQNAVVFSSAVSGIQDQSSSSGSNLIVGGYYNLAPGFFANFSQVQATAGSQARPNYTFASDLSVGFYRSGVSTIAVSTGTFNLATNAVRFSTRTLAASALTTSAANTNVAVNEMVFTVGGASGASLAIHSGGTVYIFNSAISARAT